MSDRLGEVVVERGLSDREGVVDGFRGGWDRRGRVRVGAW